RVACALARPVPDRAGADAAAAAKLESHACDLLEHGGLDALLRSGAVRGGPLADPAAVAQGSQPPGRNIAGALGAGAGAAHALHLSESGPPGRADRPLQLRLLAVPAQVHSALLHLHLPGRGYAGQTAG